MRPVTLKRIGTRLLATTALAAFVIAAPVSAKFDNATGTFTLAAAEALAKGENSGSGGGNSGSGGGNSGSGGGGGNSGSGGGDDDDDHSGGGSSGHGGGDDDPDDDPDDHQDHADDNSGRRGGDDRGNDGGPKVEISDDKIEITFADGTKEEIENGVYERKNADGRTVEERPATQADIDRLTAAATSGDFDTATRTSDDGVSKVEISGGNIEVRFADGTKEEIENGVYERKNADGRTVEERPATQEDFDRLASIAGGSTGGVGSAPGGGSGGTVSTEREFVLGDGTEVEVAGDDIEVKYSDGWKEEIEAGRYELKDPSGNTVVERAATPGDRTRLQAQLPG